MSRSSLTCLAVILAACEGSIVGPKSVAPGATLTVTPEPWPAHLLTTAEYNATVADLTGTTSRPADFFPATSATEFDANVGVLGNLSGVQGDALFAAAQTLSEEVLTDATLRARVVTCTPATATDEACPRELIATLGRRAFRRTLDTDDLAAWLQLYRDARGPLELDHAGAIAHVLRAMLSSPSFFLRLERPGTTPENIEPVALASRLSYLLWGSMPDDALIAAAEGRALQDDAALTAQVDRMLDDPRGERFVSRFLGQWLGTARLSSHNVDTTLFPMWSPTVATGVDAQARAFLGGFVRGTSKWSDVFSAPHPAEARVAPLLAADPPSFRSGFLTLPAFLTLTSHSDRTSPTARAKVIVASMFCTDMTPPPGVVAELEPSMPGTTPQTTRERLEAHRKNPACASCHNVLDPLGLSLENFDAVGRYRETEAGQRIDASGVYQGTAIDDVRELGPLLAKDKRLVSCASRKLLGFALRRSLTQEDAPRVDTLVTRWAGGTMRELAREVVLTPAFRGLTEELAP